MAKKTETKPKVADPVKKAAKPKAKSKPAAPKTKSAAKAAKPKAKGYTTDDVALRAYFIAEKRRSLGLPGDEHQDWIEAERQLAKESVKKKTVK